MRGRREAVGIGLWAIAPGRLRGDARVTEAEEMAGNRWLAPMRLNTGLLAPHR